MVIDNAIKNVKYAVIMYVTNYILKFGLRYVFVHTLPLKYLGLNSVLNDVLILLCVTEMGIGSAIVYSLYKPLSIKDITAVKAIMLLFKKVYRCIGFIIFILGLLILPFLDFFIKDNTIPETKIFFLIFLLIDAGGYFFSYKWLLLIADQKQYIYNHYHCVFLTLLSTLQMIFLLLFKNYWSFVLIMFIVKFAECYYISKIADNLYPFLKNLGNEILAVDVKSNIIKNTKALVLNKVANVLGTSSISIITSKYVGLTVVGLYSNYSLIIGATTTFCSNVFSSLTANIGNMLNVEDEKKQIKMFKSLLYISAWLGSIIFTLLLICLNDLIYLWLGKELQLDNQVVVVLVIMFYFEYMQNVVRVFKEGAGLYWQERYRPILEIAINISISIVLVKYYGLTGIIVGNIIAKLLTSFWIEPYILFSNALEYSIFKYFSEYLKYSIFVLIIAILNLYISEMLFEEVSVLVLILKATLVISLVNIFWIIIFGRNETFKIFKQAIKNKYKKLNFFKGVI